MDICASAFMAFPPDSWEALDDGEYDRLVKAHVVRVGKQMKDQKELIHANAKHLLQVLDPSVHSISVLALLDLALAYIKEGSLVPQEELLSIVTTFLVTYDARQIRYYGPLFTRLLERVADGKVLPPSVAVEAVSTALLRLDPSGSMLTSTHCLITAYAYRTAAIDQVLELISKDVVYYPGMAGVPEAKYLCDMTLSPPSYLTLNFTALLKPNAILEHDLVCGMIWCSVRDWTKAFAAFQRVVTFPTRDTAVSKIMVEAYKKWVLLGLLLHGQAPAHLPYTSAPARHTYAMVAKPYNDLGEAFATSTAQDFKNEVAKYDAEWRDDRNVSLMREVIAYFHKWQILNLQDVYSKVSIPDIREQTKSAETGTSLDTDAEVEALVREMIDTGMLKGTIERPVDGRPAYLSFQPAAEKISEAEFARALAATTKRIRDLGVMYRATNERLATNKDYIKHLVREQNRLESLKKSGMDAYEQLPPGFDSQVEDEDLMAMNPSSSFS